jgi:ribonuclease HI
MYTDGACRGNPGPGGWGVLLDYRGQRKSLNGYHAQTTNNRMELTAVIEGLKALKRPCEIDLHTDSKYVMQGINEWMNAWKQNGWKNVDLWQSLESEAARHRIRWHWVKGHSGVDGNERADQLANDAIDAETGA